MADQSGGTVVAEFVLPADLETFTRLLLTIGRKYRGSTIRASASFGNDGERRTLVQVVKPCNSGT